MQQTSSIFFSNRLTLSVGKNATDITFWQSFSDIIVNNMDIAHFDRFESSLKSVPKKEKNRLFNE